MIHQFTQGFRFIGITMSISALQGKLVTNSHLTCDILQSTLEASIIDNPTLSQFLVFIWYLPRFLQLKDTLTRLFKVF